MWAGHNIVRFDCPRIREAFEELGRAAPEPKGIIDTLHLLTKKFGSRAGDMKVVLLISHNAHLLSPSPLISLALFMVWHSRGDFFNFLVLMNH